METPDKAFIYQLTDWQNRLFGYLVTLLGNVHDAHDVLQETNVVLWKKIDEFEPGTNFGAWARKVAYFQALAFLRDRKRDKHLFDDDLLEQFAEEESNAGEEERELALRDCLAQLPDRQRDLISQRYGDGGSIRKLAQDTGKKESAMKMTLMRIRHALLGCIQSKLEAT
ncbi:MAG: sigma-70 family RNA polymerase sigma factor, partial [Verrucomicrobiota bacterium]